MAERGLRLVECRGPMISDDGGGFALGSAALRLAAASADGRQRPPSAVLRHVMAQLSLKEAGEVRV